MRERKDFAMVRLSEAGRKFAGEGETLRVVTGHMHYLFVGTKPVEVLRFAEWPLLAKDHDADGRPLFELDIPAEANADVDSEETDA